MGATNKAMVILGFIALLLLAIGLALPGLRAQAAPGAEKATVDVLVPFTTTKITFQDFPVDEGTQNTLTIAGAALLILLIIAKIILMNPKKILENMKAKQEVNSELNKMNETLEGLKRIGN